MANPRTSNRDSAAAKPLSIFDLPPHSPPPGVERRTLPRVMRRFVLVPRDGSPSCQGIDLSFSGLMCAGSKPLWPGNMFAFDLLLGDGGPPLGIEGRVVDLVVCSGGRIAMRVRFEPPEPIERERIAQWMADSQSDPTASRQTSP